MLCLFILPQLIELNKQSLQLQVNKKAEQLLYEELQAKLIDGQAFTNYTILYRGIEYKILWSDLTVTGQKEVCVQVDKNAFIQQTKLCAVSE
jgi:hypothetical protein